MRCLLLCVCMLCGLSYGNEKNVQSGDLVFVHAADSVFDDAIVAATQKKMTNYTHVGIIEVDKHRIYVLEAHPQKGVVRSEWSDFKAENPSYDVMRLKQPQDINTIIRRAKTFLGQPYDDYYGVNNGRMYCSELVYESYLDKQGRHIFEAKPMNFYAPDGSLPKYWQDLFAKLGESVPQGELGTNPNDMSQSSALVMLKKD
ncbi:hypothetical protein LS71_001905 [Helicobacter jaachi]|uniref:Permuted papain-like amidase YaeF/Yiix C92 family enzyme n=1 Tax=Helicobacter jaachi TaxID=1677920 RepID=A0A4U8TCW5_9HELI|nr:YiiX/YebB-like N1pC/P60 family cysteine hydrolase [Helicobacter jaachi]TLD97524.1 hypothetical protein LS71_001905 [Helicobacter jaachi]